jgi:hypothetical protein
MTTGENTGTWGNVTNVNFGTAVEQAITGSADVAFSSADVTLTLTDTNATQVARNLRLNLTGTSGGTRSLTVPAIQKVYIVNNGLADAVTVKNATGTGIAVPAGKTMWVYNNGVNVVDAVNAVTSLAVAGAATLGTPLATSSGGTGVNTLTGYIYGNGTSAFTASATIPGSAISGTVTASLIGNVTGNVSGSAGSTSTLTPGNDLTIYRSSSPTTGYTFLGNSGTHYFGYDGTNFTFSGTGSLFGPANGFAGNLIGNVTGNVTGNVSGSAGSTSILTPGNDLTIYRTSNLTAGFIYFGYNYAHYFGYDGGNFTCGGTGYLYGPANGFAGNLTGTATTAATANALNTSNSYTVSNLNISSSASGGNSGQLTITSPGYGSKYLRVNSATGLEIINDAYSAIIFTFNDNGDFNAYGAIYGSAKYFRITHPLASKAETTDLVHISVESPQADLIYRGQTALHNGLSVVDIDAAAGMTDGTFEALCTNVQCFTSNETGWTLVRGAVNGNLLTIEAQDATCADTISWMVIGTRRDVTVVVEPAKAAVVVEPTKAAHP